ncbi:GNAT family N-acetyltransferase [Luteimonas mephitis]|uniref:GNAT family N-acetyltransferase n=1 Tax=Luteimonas mephitis TaxID=83615 RepID=UPI003A95C840
MVESEKIRHDSEGRRFTTSQEGHEAFVEYEREGDVLVITHTIVPPEIGGRGIAGKLVEAALQHARTEGLKVRPDCSYAAAYMRRHPDYADLLAPA